jgi:hypothetical protein
MRKTSENQIIVLGGFWQERASLGSDVLFTKSKIAAGSQNQNMHGERTNRSVTPSDTSYNFMSIPI